MLGDMGKWERRKPGDNIAWAVGNETDYCFLQRPTVMQDRWIIYLNDTEDEVRFCPSKSYPFSIDTGDEY
jgi:hypothetical protein